MPIKVSIIIPAYNTEKYIAECLQSAISQTLGEIEIIVINDGSTDGTWEIINSFKVRDSRIIAITQENQGLSRSRNRGAGLAKGEYLYFMDSDDFIAPHAMEVLYKNIREKGTNLICGESIRFYEKDIQFKELLLSNQKPDQHCLKIAVYKPLAFACASGKYQITVWSYLIKKDFWDSLPFKFIEGVRYEDCEFSNKTILLSGQIAYVDFAFYYYRQRRGSSIYSRTDKLTTSSAVAIVKSLHDFYEDRQFTPDEKSCYSTLISPDILRAVSHRNLYSRDFSKLVEDEIGHAFFHLKASIRLKHRIIYYFINFNIGLASSFLRLKYSFPRFKMRFKSLFYNR